MRWALAIVLCLVCGCSSTKKKPKLAPTRTVLSPMQSYLVTAQTQPTPGGDREIVISRPRLRGEILRFPYSREVNLVWAPDESAVAVVDAMTPTENRVLIFALPSGRQLNEVRRDDTCKLARNIPCGRDYQRVYFSNVVWLNPDAVQVTVEMYAPVGAGLPPEVHAVLVSQFELENQPQFNPPNQVDPNALPQQPNQNPNQLPPPFNPLNVPRRQSP